VFIEDSGGLCGPLFLKYISDAFEQRRQTLQAELSEPGSEAYIVDATARAEAPGQLAQDRTDRDRPERRRTHQRHLPEFPVLAREASSRAQ
jgi:type I restriction-modification system DNA methylase subunit